MIEDTMAKPVRVPQTAAFSNIVRNGNAFRDIRSFDLKQYQITITNNKKPQFLM